MRGVRVEGKGRGMCLIMRILSNKRATKRRVPLRPRPFCPVEGDQKYRDRLDAEYEQRKVEYAQKYGQAALDEELRKYKH